MTITMKGWSSMAGIGQPVAVELTTEQVRALLAEGKECRKDIEQRIRRMRAPREHRFGGRVCDVCGVLARGQGALRPCPGYWRSR